MRAWSIVRSDGTSESDRHDEEPASLRLGHDGRRTSEQLAVGLQPCRGIGPDLDRDKLQQSLTRLDKELGIKGILMPHR